MPAPLVSRRGFVGLGLCAIALRPIPPVNAQAANPAQLKPGQFVWTPELAADGAVVIIVSLPEQLVHVYRNGIEIGISTCSTGKPGHVTPTGVFTILEKERQHVSSIYQGAQMPNMERLTWGGVALHAGNLPGFPASHGCVRLPLKFSELLFGVTHVGSVVIIAAEHTQPRDVAHAGALLPPEAEAEAEALTAQIAQKKAHSPWEATVSYPVVSMLVSRADRLGYITRDGEPDGSIAVKIQNPETPIGTHVYSLTGPAAGSTSIRWLAFGTGTVKTESHITTWQGDAALRRVSFADRDRALAVARTFHPGTTLMITDLPAAAETRNTPKNFAVMANDAGVN